MELTPDFSISINGGANFPKERVLSITVRDEAGIVSDSCDIELDDFDGALQFPNTEAKIVVALGYKETGLAKLGTYFVKEITIDGARHTLRIQGNAVSKAMRSQKTKSNEGTISDYAVDMADDFELDSAVSDNIQDLDLEDDPQFGESDMNYLTRMSQKVGAVAKPVDGHLVIAEDMSSKSVTGKNLPVKNLNASDVMSYSCTLKETETSGGASGTVYANWYDKKSGEYYLIHVGSGEPETELNEIFKSDAEARSAAQAKFKRTSKANRTFRFSVAGRTDLFAESPLMLQGFPSKIPRNWIIEKVEHKLDSSGSSTSVDCCCGE